MLIGEHGNNMLILRKEMTNILLISLDFVFICCDYSSFRMTSASTIMFVTLCGHKYAPKSVKILRNMKRIIIICFIEIKEEVHVVSEACIFNQPDLESFFLMNL